MTLRRRLSLQIAAMLAGVALLAAAGVVGVSSLRADLDVSLHANDQLRHVFTVGTRVAAARLAVERSPNGAADAAETLDQAAVVLGSFEGSGSARQGWIDGTASDAAAARDSLRSAATQLRRSGLVDPSEAFAAPYARLAGLVSATRSAVVWRQATADEKQRWAIVVLAVLGAVVTGGAMTVAVLLYRGVIRPLSAVRAAAGRVAAGQFATRADARGDAEFAALAGDFNRMAADLETLYGDLEARIATKGRELAQSERLASVGFLAAGVAHEINNPLGIIAGHGERALARLGHRAGEPADGPVADSLRIICDEAFRCKRITDGLLTLARPDESVESLGPVPLDALVADVVATLTAMPAFATRRVTVQADAGGEWDVVADPARLRQIVLNLLLNALEATPEQGGRVRVRLWRPTVGATIAVEIEDNGTGLSPESLGRVFEPFYSEKRHDGRVRAFGSGTGLGLSVAHAIVRHLGGTIQARSDGPGRGSTFAVRLPAASTVDGQRGTR